MNEAEAEKLLLECLSRFRGYSHSRLARFVEAQRVDTYEVRGASGTTYQIEIQYFWDDRPGETIRVTGSVDDGSIRAFAPLCASVLTARPQK